MHPEEHLHIAQRLETIGRLAGGVPHVFNNLLSLILSYTDFALESPSLRAPVRSDLTEVYRAAERASALSRQLLAFGRKQIWEPRELDLNRVITKMRGILHPLLGKDIELLIVLPPSLGKSARTPGKSSTWS